jgi:RNA polymerase primary sigma factor
MELDVYKSYVKQIQRYPLLKFEEEAERAKIRLVQCNLRLVVSVAKKFTTQKVSIMDLIQEGNIGLMTAAAKYKASYKTRFSTYAYSWILQYMLRYLYNKCPLISIPHRKDEMLRRISAAQNFLFQQTGHMPSEKELAVYLGMTSEALKNLLQYSYSVSSIDLECGDDTNTTVGDLIEDTTFSPEKKFMNAVTIHEIRTLLSVLPHNEQLVIYHRYNLAGEHKPKTLREVSTMLGVSTETVRQMEIRAIKHMQEAVLNSSENGITV